MTFDELYDSIIQEAPLTSPVVPKIGFATQSGMPSINATQTPIKPTAATQQTAGTDDTAQSSLMNKQTNAYSANTFKIIKDLQTQVQDLSTALGLKSKKPSIMSPVVNPQVSA